MGRHFISVLGAGNYFDTIYSYENREAEPSPYVQEALLELFMENPDASDKITIFVTKKSKEVHYDKLRERLIDKYKEQLKEPVLIEDGRNEREFMDIFKKINESIEEEEELIVDVTHGFRSIPMQMLAVVCFTRVIKNVKISGIYYGAFEAKDEENKVPVFSLMPFLRIIDWTQAANVFVKNGVSTQAKEVFDENKDVYPELEDTVSSFVKLTEGLETSKGKFVKEKDGSAQAAYIELRENYNKIKDYNDTPVGLLLNHMFGALKMFDVESNTEFGIATVKWAVKYSRIQQGFTALEETMKTYLCNRYERDELTRKNREDIIKSSTGAISSVISEKKKKDEGFNILVNEQEVRKEALISFLQFKYNMKRKDCELPFEEMVKKVSGDKRSIVRRVNEVINTVQFDYALLLNEVGKIRNDLNHFGFSSADYISAEELRSKLSELMNRFEELIDKDNESK